jgi:hypothetical protein
MFDTPYQTSPCARFDLSKTLTAIRRLEINEELLPAEGSVYGVKLVPPGVTDMLPFLQPITRVEAAKYNVGLETAAVIDGRSLLRQDGRPAKEDAYKHAVRIADLTAAWLNEGPSIRKDMLNLGEFPAKVFISWFGMALAQRLSLDFGQTSFFRALVAVYYIQLFDPLPENPSQDDIDRLVVRAARYIPGVDSMTLGGILGEIPRLNNLKDFIDWARKALDSPRAEPLNIPLAYRALDYTFGPAYRESVAVALEFPPVFLALVYKTVEEHSYTKTGLGKVIERVVSKQNDKEFLKQMNHLMGKR